MKAHKHIHTYPSENSYEDNNYKKIDMISWIPFSGGLPSPWVNPLIWSSWWWRIVINNRRRRSWSRFRPVVFSSFYSVPTKPERNQWKFLALSQYLYVTIVFFLFCLIDLTISVVYLLQIKNSHWKHINISKWPSHLYQIRVNSVKDFKRFKYISIKESCELNLFTRK